MRNLILIIFCVLPFLGNSQRSVLSSGTWHKLKITESGVYKLDYNQLLQLGLADKNPNFVKVFGFGGILPQKNSDFRFNDLPEIPCQFVGGEDGVINVNDYILFYGQGPDVEFESTNDVLAIEKNPYSRETYYFITYNEDKESLRIPKSNFETASQSIDYLTQIAHFEDDKENIIISGREWYGENMKFKPQQNHTLNLNQFKSDIPIKIYTDLVGGDVKSNPLITIELNGNRLEQLPFGSISDGYGQKAALLSVKKELNVTSNVLNFKYTFNNLGQSQAFAHLDFISVNYASYVTNGSKIYTVLNSQKGKNLVLNGDFSVAQVWAYNGKHQIQQLTIDNNQVFLSDSIQKLIVINPNDFLKAEIIGAQANQNLHELGEAELIIIANNKLMSSSKDYLLYRQSLGIHAKLVFVDEIYNEYSSGRQDVTAIRDFVRQQFYSYNQLKYVLLIGDCSYDYLSRVDNNNNLVPIYESRESLDNTETFSSDDYFGFLEENEGEWKENRADKSDMEIGIGRIPASNDSEVLSYLGKIKTYEQSDAANANWKNRIIFVADDEDNNLHTQDAKEMSDEAVTFNQAANPVMVLLDAYTQQSTSAGQFSPSASNELKLQIDRGALIVNFSGHGNEIQWTQENILTLDDISKMNNKEKLPFYITATCEFGRYDDPGFQSGAEKLLFNSNGGAIGLMTTTRPVYATSNSVINKSFYQNVFARNDDSLFDRIGEVHRKTKNASIEGVNNRNFALLGDPSMFLSFPSNRVITDSINGKHISTRDTVGALDLVRIQGHIATESMDLDEEFNGTVWLTFFDKAATLKTKGDGGSTPIDYEIQKSIIFEGSVSVNNGKFSFEFIVPKDISYQFDNGKLSFFARDFKRNKEASGAESRFIVGGGNENLIDDKGPEIQLYINDLTFRNGGISNPDPIFIAKVKDESGINTTTAGLGHEISLVLDDNFDELFTLNEFYSTDNNSYSSGSINYPLFEIENGFHTLNFKVWDVNNNSSEAMIGFYVSETGLVNVFPNPFYDQVNMQIVQGRDRVAGSVAIEITDMLGKFIFSNTTEFQDFNSVNDQVIWTGKTSAGENISSGIYNIRTEVRYQDGLGDYTEFTKLFHQK